MDAKEEIYGVSMAAARMCNAITNVAGQFPSSSQTKAFLLEMGKEGAQLLLNFGDNEEIIVGANALSRRERRYKTEFDRDILTLQDVLKRDGLSNEAKEAIEQAIRDIKAKLTSHHFPNDS